MVLVLGRAKGCTRASFADRGFQRQQSVPVESPIESASRLNSRPLSSHTVQAGIAVDRLPLSSYKFPQIPSGRVDSAPLEAAVKDAVPHLDQAPFLQLQRGGETMRHSVDDVALQEPQLWRGIARHLRTKRTDTVLLVHPLDGPAPDRQHHSVPHYGEVMTGITNAAQQSRMRSFAELVRAGQTTADFSGKIGECCDGEPHSQVVPFSRRSDSSHSGASSSSSAHAQHHSSSSSKWSRSPARYWGVVLQSQDGRDAGCYVLKTSHSAVGDCTCVHWSLTRVRSGAPLFDQLSSAWLLA